jgi:hypothetical protein
MKIYVMTDLEGPAMVSRFAQTRGQSETPELKRQAMQLLTGEVNAAVDGCTREHTHLTPGTHLGWQSSSVQVCRADAKGTGDLPDFMED